jgi:DNA-binding transcriptional regulator YhcF (GntR family)
MELRIDGTNPAPASEQVRTQLMSGVRDGSLPPGAKLPTVRQLADQLGIAVNTVARAYRLLEEDGIAATQFARKAASLGVAVKDAERAVVAAIKAELG